ncbi:hypothetical protein REPUB_Repub12eG0041400 [Reevesia pubescens]
MITGKLPWEYKNTRDLAINIGFLRFPPKIPETMSSTGKDFLMKCFERDPCKRWTADMLLSHPLLLPDCPSLPSAPTKSLHHAQFDSGLDSMEQHITAMCLEFSVRLEQYSVCQFQVLGEKGTYPWILLHSCEEKVKEMVSCIFLPWNNFWR